MSQTGVEVPFGRGTGKDGRKNGVGGTNPFRSDTVD